MKNILYRILLVLQFDRLVDFALKARTQVMLMRYMKAGLTINFIPQGSHDLSITGDTTKLSIHVTSHLKSGAFIECGGGVVIGRHFHVGRGLTIFSSSHNYKVARKIPYDEVVTEMPVIIGDFVWCGANVTILPGVKIGEGAIVGASSTVTKDVPPLAVVAGNPAKLIGQRDTEEYYRLKENGAFY